MHAHISGPILELAEQFKSQRSSPLVFKGVCSEGELRGRGKRSSIVINHVGKMKPYLSMAASNTFLLAVTKAEMRHPNSSARYVLIG